MDTNDMTKLTPEAGLTLWKRAKASEFGLAVKTKNAKTFSNALWAIRQEVGGFMDMVIIFPNGRPDEIWIVHKEVKLED